MASPIDQVVVINLASTEKLGDTLLAFSESAIGLSLLALLIAYLPTMYSATVRMSSVLAPSASPALKRWPG